MCKFSTRTYPTYPMSVSSLPNLSLGLELEPHISNSFAFLPGSTTASVLNLPGEPLRSYPVRCVETDPQQATQL